MSLDSYGIEYRPLWDCFLCRQCRYGVLPGQIRAHWRKQHGIKGGELRTIVDACSLHRTEHLPGEACIPLELDTADPVLVLYDDAFQCQIDRQSCRYICRDVRDIRQHCRTAHGWLEFTRRGRPSRLVRSMLTDTPTASQTLDGSVLSKNLSV